jgi:hypothetical protein
VRERPELAFPSLERKTPLCGRGECDDQAHEYLLAELRCAAMRARLWQSDIEAVGMALKAGLIEPEQALELLADCDAFYLVAPNEEGVP